MAAWFASEKAARFAERVRVTDRRNLGRSPVVLPLLGLLGFRRSVEERVPMQRQRHLTHGEALEALVAHMVDSLGRKRVPLYHLHEWMERSGLALCYGVESSHFTDDRIGDALDAFLPHAEEVLERVSLKLLSDFQPVVGAVHHDLTSVLFTGEYEGSETITHGYNAQGSQDKQSNIGLDVVGSEGLVVWGKPLCGKENGIGTFPEAVDQVSRLLGGGSQLFVTDRIFATFENLWSLRQKGHHFDCPLSRQLVPAGWIEAVPQADFHLLNYHSQHDPKNSYWVTERTLTLKPPKGFAATELTVRALIVRSERKTKDDREGREKALQKIERRLTQIHGYLNQRRYARGEFVKQQVEAARKPPFGQYVGYEVTGEDGQLTLRWWREEGTLAEREKLDGKYVVVTDLWDAPVETVFGWHKEQHVVESRHRNLKTDLVLRPVWLQNDKRIEALLYLCVIAVMVYSLIEVLYRRSTGTLWTGRKVLEAFGDYCAHRICLAGEGEAWLLEEPSARQRELLCALGLGLPSETLASL